MIKSQKININESVNFKKFRTDLKINYSLYRNYLKKYISQRKDKLPNSMILTNLIKHEAKKNSSNIKNNFLIIIPARLKSRRLPNKPLLKFNGIPMIILTAMNCAKVINKNKIIITTDSKVIKKLSESYGFKCILTSSKCLTGTDRVAEVAKKLKKIYTLICKVMNHYLEQTIFLNLSVFHLKNKHLITNAFCKIKKHSQYNSNNVPKVVFDQNKNLIYMSRSKVPGNKKGKFIKAFRQVCIYSFPRNKLLKFSKLKEKTFFENIEDIEILRFIETGEKVKMIELSDVSISVDTPKDYRDAIKIYKNKN